MKYGNPLKKNRVSERLDNTKNAQQEVKERKKKNDKVQEIYKSEISNIVDK